MIKLKKILASFLFLFDINLDVSQKNNHLVAYCLTYASKLHSQNQNIKQRTKNRFKFLTLIVSISLVLTIVRDIFIWNRPTRNILFWFFIVVISVLIKSYCTCVNLKQVEHTKKIKKISWKFLIGCQTIDRHNIDETTGPWSRFGVFTKLRRFSKSVKFRIVPEPTRVTSLRLSCMITQIFLSDFIQLRISEGQ